MSSLHPSQGSCVPGTKPAGSLRDTFPAPNPLLRTQLPPGIAAKAGAGVDASPSLGTAPAAPHPARAYSESQHMREVARRFSIGQDTQQIASVMHWPEPYVHKLLTLERDTRLGLEPVKFARRK